MPTLRFVSRSRTYADAAPLDVAITETMLIAIACFTSRPTYVSTGTSTTPPPMPLMDPTNPATIATRRRDPADTGVPD